MKRVLVALLITAMLIPCSCTVNINVAEEPEGKEAIAEETEVIEPESVEPESVEPEAVEPEAVEPEAVEPEAVEPEAVEPESVEPEVVEPEVVEPEAVEPEVVEPEVVEPEAVEPEAVEPEVVEPEVVEPEAVEPEVVEPEAVEPEAAIKAELTVDKAPDVSLAVDGAEYVIFDEMIEGEESKYHTFVPDIDGVYRFEMCKLTGNEPNLYIIDQDGGYIANKAFAKNGEGCTVSIAAGITYTAQVKGANCSYGLKIWKQKPTVNVSDYTLIKDSMEFNHQSNVYTFVPQYNGTYGVGIADGDNDIQTAIRIEDVEGNLISRSAGVKAGENIYGDGLKAGNTYYIHVTQSEGFGNYTLSLGLQKDTLDISDYSAVHDSVVFTGQKNFYSFIPQKSGSYTFTLTAMEGYNHGAALYVSDSKGNILGRKNYCINGDYVTINAEAGKKYTVQVSYYLLSTKYTLLITP